MSVRDRRADGEHFRQLIEQLEARCAKADERVDSTSKVWAQPANRAIAAGDAMEQHWALFSAAYSAGESREQLRARFERVLCAVEREKRLAAELIPSDLFAKRFKAENKGFYRQLLWLVSLACALDVDDETFDRVVGAVDFGWRDRLIDVLIASRRADHPVAEDLAAPSVVRRLGDAVDAVPAKQQRLVKQHAANWYSTWRGVYGWGDHTVLPRLFYHGYWSFESAGFVRALGIDDVSFRDDEYYPGELLAREERTDV